MFMLVTATAQVRSLLLFDHRSPLSLVTLPVDRWQQYRHFKLYPGDYWCGGAHASFSCFALGASAKSLVGRAWDGSQTAKLIIDNVGWSKAWRET
jgi:hypothetical protein